MTLDERIKSALAKGPLDTYSLAGKLWPCDSRAWNVSANGGPPGWTLPLGKAIKRIGLRTWMNGKIRMVGLARDAQ